MSTFRARLHEINDIVRNLPADFGESQNWIGGVNKFLEITPAEWQEVTSLAMSGELGEGLAALALGRVENLAADFADMTAPKRRAALKTIHTLARDAYHPEDHNGYAAIPQDRLSSVPHTDQCQIVGEHYHLTAGARPLAPKAHRIDVVPQLGSFAVTLDDRVVGVLSRGDTGWAVASRDRHQFPPYPTKDAALDALVAWYTEAEG